METEIRTSERGGEVREANRAETDIKTWAVKGAERFQQVWEFQDYWKRSNTFHSFLRFVDAAEQRWGKSDPALKPLQSLRTEMVGQNALYFRKYIGGQGVWVDDYGWCGLSCMAARNHLQSVGDEVGAQEYAGLAVECWNQMKATGYDPTISATPVPHGCGNVSPERKKNGGGYGTKNTVTNVNLLLLSLQLYFLYGETQYRDMVVSQLSWFTAWFSKPYSSLDDGPYLRTLPGPLSLIHERPMAEKSYVQKDFPDWRPGWIWTGDQGLVLVALAQVLSTELDVPDVDSALLRNVFVAMSAGVEALLFGGADKVLREPPFESSFGPSYAPDYVGGRGVLLRYVSEPIVQKVLGRPFARAGILATAQAVWNSRDPDLDQFAPLWNADGDAAYNQKFVGTWGTGDASISAWDLVPSNYYGVLQANGLDALTAAIRLGSMM
jgi:hypothetical protein